MPDSCNIVASLTAKSIYQSSYQVTVCDTLRFRRYTAPPPNPCKCPFGLDTPQLLDPASDYHPVTTAYANSSKIWRLSTKTYLLCDGISVGSYVWQNLIYGLCDVQFGVTNDSTGEIEWWSGGLRTTRENWVWVKFPFNNPYGPAPEPGDSTALFRVQAKLPGDRSVSGPPDSCAVKHRYLTVYWSRCQSPSADSSCPDCCVGPSVGNVDESPDHLVTMGDMTVLIDHLFGTLQPLACPTAGNMDMSEDGLVTMGDLTVLIDHLFISLDPLPPCPY
jgi:hypothetical protein